MSTKITLTVAVVSMLLTACSAFNGGSELLSDKKNSDSFINSKVIDGETKVSSLSSIIGKKDESRSALKKTFPDGKLSVASYTGFLNGMTGTYAHRVLSVVYGPDNVVINHGIFVKDLHNANKYNLDYISARNLAFTELDKGSDKTKVMNLLGNPDGMTFTDEGDLLLIYSKTDISRDVSSYIPVVNMISGTESGVSERLYIEMSKNGKVKNIISATVQIVQGRGIGNADSYIEKYENIQTKF